MSNTDTVSRVIFLRPKPHPYDYHNIGRALSDYMREPEFLGILVNIFESAPHLYQDFIPDEDMFNDEAPPQTKNHEQPSQYITHEIDYIQWRIDVCAVPNAEYYRGDRAKVNIVSCVVADLSGGSVQIKLTCHKPEAKRLVEAIEAVIQETWLSGEEGSPAKEEPSQRKDPQIKEDGPSKVTQERAKIFRSIKEKYPELTQEAVAIRANEQDKHAFYNAETVRNTYDEMGWKWKRGARTRR